MTLAPVTSELSKVLVWQDSELPVNGSAPRAGTGNARTLQITDRENDVSINIGTINLPTGSAVDRFSPRHRHTFDQVRYYHSGPVRYGKEIYGAGDLLYVPGGVHYGPREPQPTEDPVCHLYLQFQGNSGIPYYAANEMEPARERLEARGHFDKGIYIPDEGKKQDGWEALLEETTGKKVEYSQKYRNYVVVRTHNLDWHEAPGLDGVRVKHVGHFTEVGPNVVLFDLPAGTSLPGGERSIHQIWFLAEGKVRFDDTPDKELVPAAVRFAPRGTSYEGVEAVEDSQVLLVQWAAEGDLFPPSW